MKMNQGRLIKKGSIPCKFSQLTHKSSTAVATILARETKALIAASRLSVIYIMAIL